MTAIRTFAVLLALSLASSVCLAQSPTPHPRLLFTSSDIAGLQSKVSMTGTPPADSYNQMVTSAGLQTSGSSQFAYVVYRSLRRMTEVAFRYQMTGNVSYGNNAKNLLMTMANFVNPTGSSAYLSATYPCAMALTFDWVYPLLSSSEKATIVSELEAWVTAMRNGSNGWASYSSYSSANDNHSLAWCTGIAFTLMAIEGDSSYPNLQGLVNQNMQMLHDGWMDAISPDGSVDESYGYSNYGNMYSMNAGVAAINCGYGDWLAGTNVLKVPAWLTASAAADSFLWTGDSSPTHKGDRIDPVCYYPLTRADAEDPSALWGLNQIMAKEVPGDATPSQAWSPHVHRAIYYPANLTPQIPEVLSSFFRDNLNQGSATSNKLTSYPQVGNGGHAFLHNSTDPTWDRLSAYYLVRDEWMTHNHEDDGHFSLSVAGKWAFLDIGYANQSNWSGAQSTDHNIVLAQGAAPFRGSNNNYYNPPAAGRYLGEKREAMFSPHLDYVRGTHANMWMMQKASRSVIMIKDQVTPYVILVDQVDKDGGTHVYEEVFHSGGPASGDGTVSNPMTVSTPGATTRSVWISPTNVNVHHGSAATNASTTYYRHRVTASGDQVTFLSVHGTHTPMSSMPLAAPLANTRGASMDFGTSTDMAMVRTDAAPMGDMTTQADAEFLWIRRNGQQVSAWAAGEALHVTHDGIAMLAASEPVTVSVKDGRVWVKTATEDGVQGVSLTLYAPFTVNELVVDDQPQSFTQVGLTVILGDAGLPTLSQDDRLYSFMDGYLWDAVPSANLIINQDAATSASSWSWLNLKNGQQVGGRPLSLSMDVNFAPNASGPVAGFKCEDVVGTGNILSAMAVPLTSTTFRVTLMHNGGFLGTSTLPLGHYGNGGRFTVELAPTAGSVSIADALGVVHDTFGLTPTPGLFRVRAVVCPLASIDNVSLFDSAEDGVTPQGVCFYANSHAIGGFGIRVPGLLNVQDWCAVQNGEYKTQWLTQHWFNVGSLAETVVVRYALPGTYPPVSLQEAAWEFAVPSVSQVSGASVGIWIEAPNTQELLGIVAY